MELNLLTARFRLDGRVALVTHAATELGGRLVDSLAGLGAAVIATDHRHSFRGERGGEVTESRVDVSTPEGARTAVAQATGAFGRLDIVVNIAAPASATSLDDWGADELAAQWRSTVTSAFNVAQAAWPVQSGQGYGRIVNIGHTCGLLFAQERPAAYDIAMGGVAAMTRAMAAEGRDAGIAVNCVLRTGATAAGSTAPHDATALVPLVAWLSHDACNVDGRFFAVGGSRIAEVFTCAARGYQCPDPPSFSLENVRDNWARAKDPAGAVAPFGQVDYNAFRVGIYHEVVGSP
jgi:NAD(P)-dependent dehydrogenase (short-subunit alcohol dehydrogenase family)